MKNNSDTNGFESPIPTVEQTQIAPANLRDYRYCEVVPAFRAGNPDEPEIRIEYYNTIGCNTCPAELWDDLEEEAMRKEYGALAVLLNGPRFWVVNEIEGRGDTSAGRIVDFGGIQMKWVAQMQVDSREEMKTLFSQEPYTELTIERDTTWIYWEDNMVYELINSDGDVYRMQAYSRIVDSTLRICDLDSLGERPEMGLPQGWTYRARVLDDRSELRAEGEATILQDTLENTYQKVKPGE